MHNGFIVEVRELRPHVNADKLQLATFFGETVVVGLDTKIGDIGIYFPCDLQLSEEYCDANDLCRKRPDGTAGNGYLDRGKRNVAAIRLRGEKSFGLYMPIASLAYTGIDLSSLSVGSAITVVNGHEICCKYIPLSNNNARSQDKLGNKTRKKSVPIAPLFKEHVDTEQLAYNLDVFKPGDHIEITLKMHGTSQRTGYLPALKGYRKSLLDWILRRPGTAIYDWDIVTGTRRTVLDTYEGGYYGSNEFREPHSKFFAGKLQKGESVYYEVVGFVTDGKPIMPVGNNKKLNDDNFIKHYGETTTFSYGCSPTGTKMLHGRDDLGDFSIQVDIPQSDIYVYRMTMTNEDGDVVEYTPDYMHYRCEQMGVKTVPVFTNVILPNEYYFDEDHPVGEYVRAMAEQYYEGADPIGKTHIREGVVVRIVNRPKFTAYKHKNHTFKVISGIIAESVADGKIAVNEEILIEI